MLDDFTRRAYENDSTDSLRAELAYYAAQADDPDLHPQARAFAAEDAALYRALLAERDD